MLTIRPVKKALIPKDTGAAQLICGPNYDEFQNDQEIFEHIKANPESILRITMAHCDVPESDQILKEGSSQALDRSAANMTALIDGPLTEIAQEVLWVYEIGDRKRPGVRQLGLGGMARTAEIRTEKTPAGSIIRNEAIYESKARGRAELIQRIRAYIGTVNNAVEDPEAKLINALEAYADSKASDYSLEDEEGNLHKIYLVREPERIDQFIRLFEEEACAYVADGNHRSAAAAMLGEEEFLAVFFTVQRMRIAPYNRLVKGLEIEPAQLIDKLRNSFRVEELTGVAEFQSQVVHEIGLYLNQKWYKLIPYETTYNPANVVEVIDADIVQRKIFSEILNIANSSDPRLTYVGDNHRVAYLKQQVDSTQYDCALTLAPVSMGQFMDVCHHNLFMPPKSTWFEPKIRSGLVMALLD